MPSDEALRVTLVCTLPLLHFSLSRVAVVRRVHQRSASVDDVAQAVPPPPLDVPDPLARPTRQVRVTLRGSHSFRATFFSRCLGSPVLEVQRVLGDSLVCSQPPRPFSRALAHRTAHPGLRVLRCHPTLSGFPLVGSDPASAAPFPARPRLLTLTVLGWAAGPVSQKVARLTAAVWNPWRPCALFSQRTRCRG
jgi:hypothetical protein